MKEVGGRRDRTVRALSYLEKKELIQKTGDEETWILRKGAFRFFEGMLAIYRKVDRRPSQSVLRYLLAIRPFRLQAFLQRAKGEGFTRKEGLRFLKRERQRGYLKETVILLLGLQMVQIESFRFYRRVKFVDPDEFRSFKAQCDTKKLDFMEEEFLVGQYPPAIVRRAQRFLEKNDHRSLTQSPSTWFFIQEFRKRVLSENENIVYGICH